MKKPFIKQEQMIAIKNSTGEIMDTAKITMIVERDIQKYKGEPFTMLFQAVTAVLVKDIKPLNAKLLLYLCSISEYGNFIDRTVDEIADYLGYKKRWIIQGLSELEKDKIIVKFQHPTDKRRNVYALHPQQSWKGKIGERKKAINTLDKNQLLLFDVPTVKPVNKEYTALRNNTEFEKR